MLIVRKNNHKMTGIYKHVLLTLSLFMPLLSFNQNDNPYKIRKVVIDPGHGGKDSGALTSRSKEKDIVLKVALKLGEYIEKNLNDVEVIYTRKTDVYIPLAERAAISNNNHADLFISIHVNSFPGSSRPYGAETFVMGLHKTQENLEVAMKENAVITLEEDYTTKYEGFDPNSSESYIIFSLLQNSYLDQSLTFAALVQNQFRERVSRHDRGVKQAGFLVLKDISAPRVLIELGFLSNPKEERFLTSPQGQTYLASAIFRAFKDYKNSIEHKNQNTTILNQENQHETSNQTYFKVQLLSSEKRVTLTDQLFNGLEHMEVFEQNGLYKYATGKYLDYEEVKKYLESLKEKFPGSFVIAIENKEIKPVANILKN